MPSIFDYYSAADLGIEPEYDEPTGHCFGAAYPGAKGCGRFVPPGEYICASCKAESDSWYQAESDRDAQLQAEMDAYNNRQPFEPRMSPDDYEGDDDLPF